MKKTKNIKTLENLNKILWVAVALLAIELIVYYLYFSNLLLPESESRTALWGTFGDFLGGTLNPMFALLSLYAIITTIKIQSEELELTRKAMEESNQAQQEQSDSFKKQNMSVKLQTFENTFFKLLEHHNGLIEKFNKEIKDQAIVGVMAKDIEDKMVNFLKEKNNGIIKKYFITLYQLLKFISIQEDNFKNEPYFNPKLYSNIIRATFDDNLIILLAINCTFTGFEKYKELIEKYALLEHLDIDFIRNIHFNFIRFTPKKEDTFMYRIVNILAQYDPNAFGKNTDLLAIISDRHISEAI